MAEKYEPDEWEAVVCNGFTAVNVLSSSNVEELGWDYTEMELDPTGTCGLFEGMLLDWDDDTPEERREHEEYFPDAFTVGARILADEWDHELSNDEVRSRCFLIIEHADQFTDHDTGRDWLCESTLADFSEVEAMTFFQNLTLMEPQDIAELDGLPIIPSAGPEECRAAVLAFNQKMIARRRERGLGDVADPGSVVKKTAPAPKPVAPKREQTIRGLGRVDFSGLGYGWGTEYPDSLSVNAIGIDYQSDERNAILNFSPITHAVDVDSRKFFCHETTMGYDRNADSWSGATIGPDFWTFDGEEAREFADDLYYEGDVIDAALDWQDDYLPCVCHRGGQGEDDRWEYEPTEDYRPFTRPAYIPESIFDKLCASQGTTIEKVVNDPVTPFERSFREDIFNMPQNRPVGLAVLATLPLDAFLDASLSMICRGEGENAGTFTIKPGTHEPIFGIYDPVGGCGGTMGTVLDRDFEIDPHDISYTMMEPVRGEWKSDRIDLYTPQDCFGFSDPFGGRIEYSEKKPKIAVAVKPDPVELGHRAAVATSLTAGDCARRAGIKQ